MIRLIPQAPSGEDFWTKDSRGTWRGSRINGEKRSANFCCPGCGQRASLSHHTIAEDGKVSPSVVCPTEGCTFHEWIQLEGWSSQVQE